MFDRAERRHHIERLKETRKHYWGYGRRGEQMDPKQLARVVQHPQMCSCPGCGNARKHFGNSKEALTLQEQSQIEALRTYEFKE
jgi:hypothetical protein